MGFKIAEKRVVGGAPHLAQHLNHAAAAILQRGNSHMFLETNKKAMAVAKLKLVQNAERDSHNIKILEDIRGETSGANKERLSSLVSNFKLQSRHSNWEEFEMIFSQVNSSFLEVLNERYPQLTPNERKLCVFMKLNMGNKDIANITFQSEEALKKSRLRLRQKLYLDRSTNPLSFIQSL